MLTEVRASRGFGACICCAGRSGVDLVKHPPLTGKCRAGRGVAVWSLPMPPVTALQCQRRSRICVCIRANPECTSRARTIIGGSPESRP
jgi:hypothetical protein